MSIKEKNSSKPIKQKSYEAEFYTTWPDSTSTTKIYDVCSISRLPERSVSRGKVMES